MDALTTELQRIARKPPQTVPVDTEPPFVSDLEDFGHALLPRKCKRRDTRSRVLITDPVQNRSTPIEPSPVAQNIESTFTESSPVIQEMSSPILESTPMDHDFQSPIIEEEVLPSEGDQASGISFETPDMDLSKGKNKLPNSELVDVVLLQNRVFDLEQSSTEKDLIIGKQYIRISEIEKESSIKDAKILELQANLGGLTALFFDLKQRLHQKYGVEFQPLSTEGENISASSSGATDSTSQPTSERVFISSGPTSAQE
uniref:Uncharacterized protein n=1 Tax=Lactuca sativa TaxID=4236 RepID=A0A9R1VKJ8_LACSA|nr:hypothetical protein LSAT_V11C500297960 [Lactuca sativa]